MENITIQKTKWAEHKKDLIEIRTRVFINEQMVPPDLEWDGYDKDCWHVIAKTDDGQCVGTARLLYDGQIGRMAVLPEYRKQGIGSAMLGKLHEIAVSQGIENVFLHAQTGAIEFYRKHGYIVNSEMFMDAGIPHVTMEKSLRKR